MLPVKKKIYLDSTVPNYVFNDEYKEKQKAAELLFQRAKQVEVYLFVSPVTIAEVQASDEPKRSSMLKLLEGCVLYEKTTQAEALARMYIKLHVFTKQNRQDARHAAYGVYYQADVIASYNFSHIVRLSTISLLQKVNLDLGFQTPQIRSPEELL